MSDINDLTDEQLDAAFNDAAAEADSELSLSNFSGDDEHEGREPSQHDDLPEDDSDSVLSNQVQPQQQVSAPPRPAAQQADAPAWINSIADNATREQALSDWTRLRHSEASQRGRVASLNRKWSEAQELLAQREQSQAAGEGTAATENKLAQIKENDQAVIDYGSSYAASMCATLLKNGAPGIHLYTLNKSQQVESIVQALRANGALN